MGHMQRQSAAAGARRSAIWLPLLALLCLGFCGVSTAHAQVEVDRDSILRELERTDQTIERARELIPEATIVSSHQHLQVAVRLQREAWERFRENRDNTLRMARELTLRARQEALKAMDALRAENNTRESVRRAIDRAEEQALEIGPVVRESTDAQARRFFEQGLDHLRRARRADRDRQFAQAMRLASLALNLIDRAGQIAQGGISAGAAAETSIERTRVLLSRIESTLTDQAPGASPPPELREARRLLRQASESLREGRPRQALRQSLAARQRLMPVLARTTQDLSAADVSAAIEDLQSLFAELGPEIEATGEKQERRILAEGRKMLRRARALLQQGELREALQHLVAAERLLKQAARSAGI